MASLIGTSAFLGIAHNTSRIDKKGFWFLSVSASTQKFTATPSRMRTVVSPIEEALKALCCLLQKTLFIFVCLLQAGRRAQSWMCTGRIQERVLWVKTFHVSRFSDEAVTEITNILALAFLIGQLSLYQ